MATPFAERIQHELRSLSGETKKHEGIVAFFQAGGNKQQDIREAAERAIVAAQQLAPAEGSGIGSESQPGSHLAGAEEILEPFLLAASSRRDSLICLGLGGLHTLAVCGALSDEQAARVAKQLHTNASSQDETVRHKVLQASLALLRSNSLPAGAKAPAHLLSASLDALCRHEATHAVKSTAAATLRQACAILFSHLQDETERQENGRESPAGMWFNDLCLYARGYDATWLTNASRPSRALALDLIAFVLDSCPSLFRSGNALEGMLSGAVCPALMEPPRLNEGQAENLNPPGTHKAWTHCVGTLLLRLADEVPTEGEILAIQIARATELGQAEESRMAAMDCIKTIFTRPDVVLMLFRAFDMNKGATAVLLGLVNAIGNAISLQQTRSGPGRSQANEQSKESTAAACALESLHRLCDSLSLIANGQAGETNQKASEQGNENEKGIENDTADSLAQPIAMALGAAINLGFSSDERCDESLQAMRILAHACAKLNAADALEPVLSILATEAIQEQPLQSLASTQGTERSNVSHRRSGSTGSGNQKGSNARSLRQKQQKKLKNNVRAMEMFVQISEELSSSLGDAWETVSATFAELERIVEPSTGNAHEQGGDSETPSIQSLAGRARNIFAMSGELPADGLTPMLDGVACASVREMRQISDEVTSQTLATSAQHAGKKVFLVHRIVDVLLANAKRLEVVWQPAWRHIRLAVGFPEQLVRSEGLQALSQALSGLLDSQVEENSSCEILKKVKAKDLESLLVSSLRELVLDAELFQDARLGALQILQEILQRHGSNLKQGWEPALVLLKELDGEKAPSGCLSLAFAVVQLVAQDYTSSIPLEHLPTAVEMGAVYAQSQADLNISLTAVGLLWTMADFFGRLGEEDSAGASTGQPQPSKASKERMESLMLPLCKSLAAVASDPRPEVRHSCLRALVGTLVSHGRKLSSEGWKFVSLDTFFPLVSEANKQASDAATTQHGEEATQANTGQTNQSGNEHQRQWNETLVLCLGGASRVCKAHMHILYPLDGFERQWSDLMDLSAEAFESGPRDVGTAAVSFVMAILQAHANTSQFPDALLVHSFRAISQFAVRCNSAHPSSRIELAESLPKLYRATPSAFQSSELKCSIGCLEAILRSAAESAAESKPIQAQAHSKISAVHQIALDSISSLAPLDEQHSDTSNWHALMVSPLQVAVEAAEESVSSDEQGHRGTRNTPGIDEIERLSGRKIKRHGSPSFALAESSLTAFSSLFNEQAPQNAQGESFKPVADSLSVCSSTRKGRPNDNLWRTSARVTYKTIKSGIKSSVEGRAKKKQQSNTGKDQHSAPWEEMATCMENILLVNDKEGEGSHPREECTDDDANIEAEGIRCIADEILEHSASAQIKSRRRLIDIIGEATRSNGEPSTPASQLRHMAMRKLTALARCGSDAERKHSKHAEVASMALASALMRASEVLESLKRLEEEETRKGERHREDAICFLDCLSGVAVSGEVTDKMLEAVEEKHAKGVEGVVKEVREKFGKKEDETAHLLLLAFELHSLLPSSFASPELLGKLCHSLRMGFRFLRLSEFPLSS